MATKMQMKERLRLAAARAIVHADFRWWAENVTDNAEFAVAESYFPLLAGEFLSPEDAANYLLLCAEAL